MKTLALALASVAALAVAAPAAAQSYGYRGDDGYRAAPRYNNGGAYNLSSGYVDGLFWKLDNAAAEGRLDWRQAEQLKRELRQVQEFAWPVETGRASSWQRRRLEQTVARIDAALQQRAGYRNAYGYRR